MQNSFIKYKIFISIIIIAVFFVLYIATRTGCHTFDALMFASAIKANMFTPSVFRPHNLLYLPTAISFGKILGVIGIVSNNMNPILIGQIWAALWGAVSVGLFFLIASKFLKFNTALIITLLFGSTNSIWQMSTEVEVYTLSLACTTALYLSLMKRNPNPAVAGIFLGAAILGHITNILLLIPISVYIIFFKKYKNCKFIFIFILTAFFLSFLPYILTAVFIQKTHGIYEFIKWIRSYTSTQVIFGVSDIGRIFLGIKGFAQSVLSTHLKILFLPISFILISAVINIFFYNGIIKKVALILLINFAVYSLFFIWWEPLNIEFWLIPLMLFSFLIVLAYRRISLKKHKHLFKGILLLSLVIQIIINSKNILEKIDPMKDIWYNRTITISKFISDKDQIITFNDNLALTFPLYLNHYRVVSIDMAAGAEEADFNKAEEFIRKIIVYTKETGGRVFFTEEALDPRDFQLARLNIDKEQYLEKLKSLAGSDLTRKTEQGNLYY